MVDIIKCEGKINGTMTCEVWRKGKLIRKVENVKTVDCPDSVIEAATTPDGLTVHIYDDGGTCIIK